MSKKKLNTEGMLNELRGQSVFFSPTAEPVPTPSLPVANPATQTVPKPLPSPATKQSSNHDTVVSRYHDTNLENVRKAVRQFGKEAATHRFTVEEKQQLGRIIFSFAQRGIRTNENEIARIAINLLIEDHNANGKASVLEKVLVLLNS